jgi:DNA-binding helix-hairpin-helix protein with protein kinase domain
MGQAPNPRSLCGRFVVDGEPLIVDRLLGTGGEAAVYEARTARGGSFAFKYYWPAVLSARRDEMAARWEHMCRHQPAGRTGHVGLAWPQAVARDKAGTFVGGVMPLVAGGVPIHQITSAADRAQRRRLGLPNWLRVFDGWPQRLRVATNLAAAVDAVHRAGFIIGDFNESNVLVDESGLVTLIDCDSFQVTLPDGRVLTNDLSREEYRAPEFTGGARRVEEDLFALAVHVFALLMHGVHPFDGVWTGPGALPPEADLARRGTWVLGGSRLRPGTALPPRDVLPGPLLDLFGLAFGAGAARPRQRPDAARWRRELAAAADRLTRCPSGDWYPAERTRCPWCTRRRSAAHRPAAQAAGAPRRVPRPTQYGSGVSLPPMRRRSPRRRARYHRFMATVQPFLPDHLPGARFWVVLAVVLLCCGPQRLLALLWNVITWLGGALTS